MRAGGGSQQRSLHYYIWRNDNKGLVEAIENGGDLEELYFHETPLGAASLRGHLEAVEILVKAGADVEAKDSWGMTPLIFAALKGNNEVVKLLLNAGADPDVKDNQGRSALYYAIAYNRYEAGVALMEGGANLDLVLSFNKEDYMNIIVTSQLCAPRLLTTTSATRSSSLASSTPLRLVQTHGTHSASSPWKSSSLDLPLLAQPNSSPASTSPSQRVRLQQQRRRRWQP